MSSAYCVEFFYLVILTYASRQCHAYLKNNSKNSIVCLLFIETGFSISLMHRRPSLSVSSVLSMYTMLHS